MDLWRFEKTLKKLDRADVRLDSEFEKRLHAKIMAAVEQEQAGFSLEKVLARLPNAVGLVATFVGVASAAVLGWLQWSRISNDQRLAVALAQDPDAYKNSLMDSSEDSNSSLLDSATRDKLKGMTDEELKKLFKDLQ